jgi:hypothetical protein
MSMSTDPNEKFLLAEYKVISQNFSSGFQTMAFLLALFFAYTGAALTYISHVFDSIKPGAEQDHMWILFHLDFRYLQIFIVCFISIVFTFWSHCWVIIYPHGAKVTLTRAGDLERQLSHSDQCVSFFSSYAAWYHSEKWLRRLFGATAAFFVSVYTLYVLITVYTFLKLISPQ